MANRAKDYLSEQAVPLAVLLTALAIVLVLASNLADLLASRSVLRTTLEQQKTATADGGRIEAQLEALATGTQALASGGNANAQRIVRTLQQNGISINAAKKGS